MENIPISDIQEILTSPYLTNILSETRRCLDDDSARPVAIKDFTKLRNALITQMMIKSLKRPMEFTEFTMAEFGGIQSQPEEDGGVQHVVRISTHKTAEQGRLYKSDTIKPTLLSQTVEGKTSTCVYISPFQDRPSYFSPTTK